MLRPTTYVGFIETMKKGLSDSKALPEAIALSFSCSLADTPSLIAGKFKICDLIS